jgi:hypothetical protein
MGAPLGHEIFNYSNGHHIVLDEDGVDLSDKRLAKVANAPDRVVDGSRYELFMIGATVFAILALVSTFRWGVQVANGMARKSS